MIQQIVMILFSMVLLTGCVIPGVNREESSPIQILYVAPEKVKCNNPLRNNECYLVKTDLNSEWQEYHGEIMGLIYDPGYFYELQVQYDSLSEGSANAPEKQWVLIKMNQKVISTISTDKTNSDLESFLWVLDQFGPPHTLQAAIGDDKPTIFFQNDGHLTGSTGCNRFNGTFTIDDSQIHTGSLAATKKMCPDGEGLLEQEQTILRTLTNAAKYQLEKDTLQIFDVSSSSVLIYKK